MGVVEIPWSAEEAQWERVEGRLHNNVNGIQSELRRKRLWAPP
jgi:hypothetical protein